MFPLSIYFTFFLVKNVKLIYLLHFSMIIITSVNNSRKRDISLTSVRCLFCQLQYVMCDFLRSKSFVPQCNNTISGAKINHTTFDMVAPLCCCSRNRFYRCNVLCTFLHFIWLYVFNNGVSYN